MMMEKNKVKKFSPLLFPSALYTLSYPHSPFPPFSSCPWVIHTSSLASTFPILFLPSPCLSSTYHLFSVPFPSFSPLTPLLITLHVISISVILFLFQLFAQFVFGFGFGSVFNNCEFVVILLFVFLIFFFLDKSL